MKANYMYVCMSQLLHFLDLHIAEGTPNAVLHVHLNTLGASLMSTWINLDVLLLVIADYAH